MSDISRSHDWLALLLYGLDVLANPSPAKLVESFEAWTYRQCLRPQLRRLERMRLIERREPGPTAPCRLTARGRLAALGGVDPAARWQRAWDGQWRLFLFDMPSRAKQLRLRLWRWLRAQRFGYLQNSVWLSPDPMDEAHLPLRHLKLTPESFVVLASKPLPPDSDLDLVKAAWDFPMINRQYRRVLELAARGLELAEQPDAKPALLRSWLAAEHEAWLAAVARDPLLPVVLLPPDYLGRTAWTQRRAAFTALTRRLTNGVPDL
jgi:phenylacetic acid degradation operon negative regulatory protein